MPYCTYDLRWRVDILQETFKPLYMLRVTRPRVRGNNTVGMSTHETSATWLAPPISVRKVRQKYHANAHRPTPCSTKWQRCPAAWWRVNLFFTPLVSTLSHESTHSTLNLYRHWLTLNQVLSVPTAGAAEPVRQVRRTPDQCSRQKVEIKAHVRGILIGLQRHRPLTRVRRLLPAPI